jgi:hypothetical protein
MVRIWVRTLESFQEDRDRDLNDYLKMGSVERLEILQFLREQYCKFGGAEKGEGRERLRRTVRIVQSK